MSVTTKSPLRLAGAVFSSGSINTGEQNMTTGGQVAATFFSGALAPSLAAAPTANALGGSGPDLCIIQGAGRIKDVTVHQGLTSGQSIFFYDSAAPVSGGPIAASGHKVVAVIPASPPTGASGTFVAGGSYGFDNPFQSGLCVALKSGQAGFTVTWTPEVNPLFNVGG